MTDALLDAALEQFAQLGVRRTSGDDIARRAGVNRATLDRRLGTKEQIGRGGDAFDAEEYVARFFTATVTTQRENRLLQRLLEVDRVRTYAESVIVPMVLR